MSTITRKSAADHYVEGVAAREAGERPAEHRLYHVPWVAGYLGLAIDSVYRMVARGRLRRTAVGPALGSTRIRGRDLIEFLEGR
jgi:hypothetical protein